MSKFNYEGSEQFRPLSGWSYVGYGILFCIPIIGQIMLIVFALSDKNINRRSYARSYFCWLLVSILVAVLLGGLSYFNVGGVRVWVYNTFPFVRQTFDGWERNEAKKAASSTSKKTEKKEETSKQSSSSTTTTTTTTTQKSTTDSKSTSSNTASSNSTGVRKEIKEAIDGYVKYFQDYADFMKKYKSDPGNAMSMLNDYTKMMSTYADTLAKWEAFEKDHEMNDAEIKYFTDAQIKITKLLTEAAKF